MAVLSGGTGTPKLLQGIVEFIDQSEISVIVNTAEDVEISGLYVSPDIDTLMYTFAGVVNEDTWYGVRGDTFEGHEELKRQGRPELLRIGDRDRRTKQRRTELLAQGKSLSEVTATLCKQFGVAAKILPMSDDRVQTRIYTEDGPLSFHEYWVARRAKDRVRAVAFEGVESARPAPGVLEALEDSEAIIIGPSNPVTSIGPILAVEEIREVLAGEKEKALAVSPVVGGAPVSGPAGSLMKGLGREVSPVGLAEIYNGLIGTLVIDRKDSSLAPRIEEMGIKVVAQDLLMPDIAARVRLAKRILTMVGIQT